MKIFTLFFLSLLLPSISYAAWSDRECCVYDSSMSVGQQYPYSAYGANTSMQSAAFDSSGYLSITYKSDSGVGFEGPLSFQRYKYKDSSGWHVFSPGWSNQFYNYALSNPVTLLQHVTNLLVAASCTPVSDYMSVDVCPSPCTSLNDLDHDGIDQQCDENDGNNLIGKYKYLLGGYVNTDGSLCCGLVSDTPMSLSPDIDAAEVVGSVSGDGLYCQCDADATLTEYPNSVYAERHTATCREDVDCAWHPVVQIEDVPESSGQPITPPSPDPITDPIPLTPPPGPGAPNPDLPEAPYTPSPPGTPVPDPSPPPGSGDGTGAYDYDNASSARSTASGIADIAGILTQSASDTKQQLATIDKDIKDLTKEPSPDQGTYPVHGVTDFGQTGVSTVFVDIRTDLDGVTSLLSSKEPFVSIANFGTMLASFTATPAAPVFEFKLPFFDTVAHIDLSPWDWVASMMRAVFSVLIIVGITMLIIRWWV